MIAQDFSLLFGPQMAAKLLEKWPTFYKEKVIREADPYYHPSAPEFAEVCQESVQ